MCRSVPQTEATFTLTRTSSGPISGTGIWRTSAPGAASGFTTASMVSDIQIPGSVMMGGQTVYFSIQDRDRRHRRHRASSEGAALSTQPPEAFRSTKEKPLQHGGTEEA